MNSIEALTWTALCALLLLGLRDRFSPVTEEEKEH